METWLALTAYDQPWQEWVAQRLAERGARGPEDADLPLARAAWRWLEETELLAPELNAPPAPPPCPTRSNARCGPRRGGWGCRWGTWRSTCSEPPGGAGLSRR